MMGLSRPFAGTVRANVEQKTAPLYAGWLGIAALTALKDWPRRGK
jgi:hypothetical protein